MTYKLHCNVLNWIVVKCAFLFICMMRVNCFVSLLSSRLIQTRHGSALGLSRPAQIHIGGVPLHVSEKQLVNALNATIPFKSLTLQYDRVSNNHKGFGCIWFDSRERAVNGLEALKGFTISDTVLRFEPFEPLQGYRTSRMEPDGRSIFVGNLPFGYSRADIFAYCVTAGIPKVLGVRMPKG